MDFNLQRHLRLAGVVAQFVGLFLHNWYVVLIGWTIVAVGYMWTITKIELYIESQQLKQEEEDENAIR